VTYKAIQTTVHTDAVTIIATDVAGNATEQTVTVSVRIADIAQGFVMNGENVEDHSGKSVSSAGDVNGDGLDDLIVGAYHAESYAGKSYVVFGKTDGSAVNLSAIALGTGGFVINGENADDWSGYSVSSAGDVNGDG
ncbi:integrin alpha, partial [Bathymodiolus thermophilus thioautotrophic gill symbiont]